MPKYKRGNGSVYKKRGVYYIAYYANGKQICESAKTTDKVEARRILQARLGQLAEGRYLGPAVERITVDELMSDVLTDYEVNGRKSLPEARLRVRKHLLPFFGGKKVHELTTADVKTFITQRQEAGASKGEINLELAMLKRSFNLARQAGKIVKGPYIPMLTLTNARQGFFEPWEFAAVLAKLPDYLRPLCSFAYLTGWRRGEILRLTWSQVDLEAGSVRLEPNTTKNKGGRLIFLPHDLHAILHQQWKERQEQYPTCPYVFHRRGKRILRYECAWMTACEKAGVTGKIPHDFRRTAVRNMVRAGIPERVAMQISGHKTRSIFDRYHIVSEGDLREAAKRLDGAFPQQTTTLLTTLDVATEEGYSAAEQQPPVIQ